MIITTIMIPVTANVVAPELENNPVCANAMLMFIRNIPIQINNLCFMLSRTPLCNTKSNCGYDYQK